MNAEQDRLQEARDDKAAWKKWGPYLSERQWGTVREDYSESGDAWNHFSHDQGGPQVGTSRASGGIGRPTCWRPVRRKPSTPPTRLIFA